MSAGPGPDEETKEENIMNLRPSEEGPLPTATRPHSASFDAKGGPDDSDNGGDDHSDPQGSHRRQHQQHLSSRAAPSSRAPPSVGGSTTSRLHEHIKGPAATSNDNGNPNVSARPRFPSPSSPGFHSMSDDEEELDAEATEVLIDDQSQAERSRPAVAVSNGFMNEAPTIPPQRATTPTGLDEKSEQESGAGHGNEDPQDEPTRAPPKAAPRRLADLVDERDRPQESKGERVSLSLESKGLASHHDSDSGEDEDVLAESRKRLAAREAQKEKAKTKDVKKKGGKGGKRRFADGPCCEGGGGVGGTSGVVAGGLAGTGRCRCGCLTTGVWVLHVSFMLQATAALSATTRFPHRGRELCRGRLGRRCEGDASVGELADAGTRGG